MSNNRKIYALGFFDGVHLGHQAILNACCDLARRESAVAAAITFQAHPQSLSCSTPPALISSLPDRLLLLRQYGIETVKSYPVTPEVMSTHWQDFLLELVKEGACGFVCGNDFRFGHRGQGDGAKLLDFCAARNFPCVIVPEQTLCGRRISSTYIRTQISDGDMETAVRFLGHPHMLSGTVVPGKQLGRTLGIPTANLLLPENLVVPKFGVYACKACIDGESYAAVTNVGTRPTVSGTGITVEPWILDFNGDLYGRQIRLEFYSFLRPEWKFPDLDALKGEILKNAEQTRTLLQP